MKLTALPGFRFYKGWVMALGVIYPFLYAIFKLKSVNNEKIWLLPHSYGVLEACSWASTQMIARMGLNIGQNMPSGMGRYHGIP